MSIMVTASLPHSPPLICPMEDNVASKVQILLNPNIKLQNRIGVIKLKRRMHMEL